MAFSKPTGCSCAAPPDSANQRCSLDPLAQMDGCPLIPTHRPRHDAVGHEVPERAPTLDGTKGGFSSATGEQSRKPSKWRRPMGCRRHELTGSPSEPGTANQRMRSTLRCSTVLHAVPPKCLPPLPEGEETPHVPTAPPRGEEGILSCSAIASSSRLPGEGTTRGRTPPHVLPSKPAGGGPIFLPGHIISVPGSSRSLAPPVSSAETLSPTPVWGQWLGGSATASIRAFPGNTPVGYTVDPSDTRHLSRPRCGWVVCLAPPRAQNLRSHVLPSLPPTTLIGCAACIST